MIVRPPHRQTCAACGVHRLLSRFAMLTRTERATVCKLCRTAERHGRALVTGRAMPVHLRLGASADRAPMLGPTARARAAARRARPASVKGTLPPGLTTHRASLIAARLTAAGVPVPHGDRWTARAVMLACAGAPSPASVWPTVPAVALV